MTQRTLLAYCTKGGVTGENAEIIAGILRKDFEHQLDLVNLKENKAPDVGPYDNVIIGTGIRVQRWYGRAKRFMKNPKLADKRVAIYLSSAEAGDDPEKAAKKYSARILKKCPHLDPVDFVAFGGRMPMGDKVDFTDPDKVREWAYKLGEMLK
jgi:menaquinone-dependent protoporphyrinogen oxidase